MIREILLNQILRVVDDANGSNGVQAQMGADQKRLGIGIADTADAGGAVELGQVLLKLGTERGVFNGVNLTLEPVLGIVNNHAAPAGAKMGVVVHPKKDIKGDVLRGDGPEKATHVCLSSLCSGEKQLG